MEQELALLEESMKKEVQEIKEKYKQQKKEIKEKYKKNCTQQTKRKTIPKALKNKVWDETFGASKGTAPCFVCETEIDSKNFECGHVVSEKEGGKTVLENLKPICGICNKSMGTLNLNDFKSEFFQKQKAPQKMYSLSIFGTPEEQDAWMISQQRPGRFAIPHGLRF